MKNKNSTWMLLIGVLLLAGFIWFAERGTENSYQQKVRTRTVFTVYPDSIERILLERDGVQIECVKSDRTWHMIRPTDAPVNEAVVNQMIAGMAGVQRGEIITADVLKSRGLSPMDYGFDEPRAKITFQNNRGTFTWLIGRDAPLGESLYLMAEGGSDIISAPQTLLNLVPSNPAWIRDRTLLFGETAAVRGLDMNRPAGFLQLRLTDHNGWVMQQPQEGRADMVATHAMIDRLFDSKIASFVTDEKSDLTVYGLQEPVYKITVFMQDEQLQTLHIGMPLPDSPELRYAKRADNDSIFAVSTKWTDKLDDDPVTLRDRRVLGVPAERIDSLQINRDGNTIELSKTNQQWVVTRPAKWNAEPSHVAEVLNALTQATVQTFIDTPSSNQLAAAHSARWKLRITETGKTHTLNITEPGTNTIRTVQHEEESAIYQPSTDMVRDAFADPLFYRNLTVLEIDPSQIKSISVQTGDTEVLVEKTDEGVFITPDSTLHIESNALTDLLSILYNLKAVQYSAFNPETLKPYGLDTPQTEITIALTGTDVIGRILRLGNKTEQGQFAMLQGQNIVFILPEETARKLTRKLTTAIEITPSEIPTT